ncbi:MAG: hypothetical protein JRF21_06735 [Deltaproteobacteria bacterium]|nr:hypothetical protein [Deltaproteobacteria bacterium]
MGRKLMFILFVLIVAASFVMVSGPAMAADKEKKKEAPKQYVPLLIYRTGPFAAGGSGIGSGWEDFMQLRNMQGGVNGIMYVQCCAGYRVLRAG